MEEFYNSTNLKIKLLAIKFMHKKWRRITSIDKIHKNKSITNSQIRFYILKSYQAKSSINKVRISARKYLKDVNPYLKNYAVQCLGEVGDFEDLKILQSIARSGYAKDNYSQDTLLSSIVCLRGELGI